ncbi:MAG: fumarylacetoacetate hydrolase family protein [Chloroflexi bacterium]|nr:fumarylacetoacetate hydrolase family protein [Chloroflexota bacterium]
MKLVLFDDNRLGVLDGEEVVDVSAPWEGLALDPGVRMNRLIERFAELRPKLEEAARNGKKIPVHKVKLRAPLPRPGKLVCMAVNYMEYGTRSEPAPINAFLKSPRAIIGPDETIVLPAEPATVFEHEAELALVIGKAGRNVPAARAYDYIFGYLNFIDGSARGLGAPGMDNFFPGKSWHTFAPMGPAMVTADEVKDPQNLTVRLWMNGVLRQDYPTSDMAHKIPRVVEWVSSVLSLEPGDVIATGTNHQGLGPLQDGDELEMEIDGLGRLRGLKVSDPQKRSWARQTRSQQAAREAALARA